MKWNAKQCYKTHASNLSAFTHFLESDITGRSNTPPSVQNRSETAKPNQWRKMKHTELVLQAAEDCQRIMIPLITSRNSKLLLIRRFTSQKAEKIQRWVDRDWTHSEFCAQHMGTYRRWYVCNVTTDNWLSDIQQTQMNTYHKAIQWDLPSISTV